MMRVLEENPIFSYEEYQKGGFCTYSVPFKFNIYKTYKQKFADLTNYPFVLHLAALLRSFVAISSTVKITVFVVVSSRRMITMYS